MSMSFEKKGRLEDIVIWPGDQEVDKFVYTPGIHGMEFAKGLKDGKILGMKCKDGKVYVPPLTFCPDFSKGEVAEIKGDWIVVTYTIIYEDMYGNPLEEPKVIGFLKPVNGEGGLIHYLNVPIEKVKIGLIVRPIFKEERVGNINDIKYFE